MLCKSDETFGEPGTYQETLQMSAGRKSNIKCLLDKSDHGRHDDRHHLAIGIRAHRLTCIPGDDRRFRQLHHGSVDSKVPMIHNDSSNCTVKLQSQQQFKQCLQIGSEWHSHVKNLFGPITLIYLFPPHFLLTYPVPLPKRKRIYLSWNDSCERVSLQNRILRRNR